jgi:thiol-disulfide isomerase/thioredoxin
MVMKKVILFLFSLFLSGNMMAQISWIRNYDTAIGLAKKTNKLIVMDFWATWCRPCLIMDEKLWANDEMKKLAENFVCLRVNFDYDLKPVSQYSVRAIPRVIIITSGEEVLIDKLGFRDAESYLTVLRAIPGNIGELNTKSVAQAENKKDLQANYSLGTEFQKIGKNITNDELRNSFLNCSSKYLAKAKNLCTDPLMTEEIELHSVLNDIYAGKYEKALKSIEKMNGMPGNENLTDLRHFVLAECFKCSGDQDNFQKEKNLVRNQELLEQLKN